ncbi:MAG: hypothetical protein LBC52_00150 [Treponema sp.]|jgi:hypothetical protein|nr:hypothetical protein [Treponema sp.]
MNKLSPIVKDRLILLGWIAGLLLAASLAWSLSFPYRSAFLMRSVNKSLEAMGDERIIISPLPRGLTRPALMGFWYRLYESESLFFIFVIMNEGILVPCGVEINENGKAVGFVPLGSHARQIIGRIPHGVIQVYIRRVESASAGGAASFGSGAGKGVR